MKRIAGVLVFVVSAAAFAGCASHGSDVDSESHFQCGEDGDCKNADGRTICGVSGWCEFPGSRLTVLNEQPGPVADCTTQWPPTTLRFDTAENEAGIHYHRGIRGPRLNRNGTVVVGFTLPEGQEEPRRHLIRWVGDTVSRFKQTIAMNQIPYAVSCDGMTVVGSVYVGLGTAYRWTATQGFALLPIADGLTLEGGRYIPMSVSPDGSTVWGVYERDVPMLETAIRWQGNVAEPLFTFDQAATLVPGNSAPGWSGDGSVFLGTSREGLFAKAAEAPPVILEPPVGLRPAFGTAVSFDGKVVAGVLRNSTTDDTTTHAWSSETGLEQLPDGTSVAAVSPEGVAVGDNGWQLSADNDFVWDRKHGARHLREILATQGLQIPPDTWIDACTDISVDGRVITGISKDDHGGTQIFRAILPAGTFD